MKLRPILFQTEMVQAILAGTKTQTRREVKPQPKLELFYNGELQGKVWIYRHSENHDGVGLSQMSKYCPYGQVSDLLYVRESVQILNKGLYVAVRYSDGEVRIWEHEREEYDEGATIKYDWSTVKKTPSIHVPKKYVRLFLKITDIRVERLQDITEADAIAEGIKGQPFRIDSDKKVWFDYLEEGHVFNPIHSYESLWKSINGPESWETNPFVWVVTFERVEKPV